jgi:hypothetical protein
MYEVTKEMLHKHHACQGRYKVLISAYPGQEEFSLKQILYSNGIQDAVWALRCLEDDKHEILFYAAYEAAPFSVHVWKKAREIFIKRFC